MHAQAHNRLKIGRLKIGQLKIGRPNIDPRRLSARRLGAVSLLAGAGVILSACAADTANTPSASGAGASSSAVEQPGPPSQVRIDEAKADAAFLRQTADIIAAPEPIYRTVLGARRGLGGSGGSGASEAVPPRDEAIASFYPDTLWPSTPDPADRARILARDVEAAAVRVGRYGMAAERHVNHVLVQLSSTKASARMDDGARQEAVALRRTLDEALATSRLWRNAYASAGDRIERELPGNAPGQRVRAGVREIGGRLDRLAKARSRLAAGLAEP